jgi:heat shock protein HtpX
LTITWAMDRYHLKRAQRRARLCGFEEHLLLAGILLIVAGAVAAWAAGGSGGSARVLGVIGLGALAVCATYRGLRLYRASAAASMPSSVGRVAVRIRPRRLSTALTVAFALMLPAAVCVALVALVEWGWLAIAGVLLVGGVAMLVRAVPDTDELRYGEVPPVARALLERLCMRADTPVPELLLEPGPIANAWTTGGRVHLTRPLLRLLDESELEAVLAHELTHLAHRDAAVMDVCSAPSRVLLGFAGGVVSGFRAWARNIRELPFPRLALLSAFLAVVSVPPAYLLGWVSRLSVLRMSRTREFAADAAAATLTGRPSALASALMKLDGEREWVPEADLRRAEAHAVLCILGTDTSRLGRLFCSHPPTSARVKRLHAIEQRMHETGRGRAC